MTNKKTTRSTKPPAKVTTRSSSSTAVTTCSTRSSAAANIFKSSKAPLRKSSIPSTKASPAPSSRSLLGPTAAEYLKAQEEKRKKDIRDRVKAIKASEEADLPEEEDVRATSPPATSDVDEEEFYQVYGQEEISEEHQEGIEEVQEYQESDEELLLGEVGKVPDEEEENPFQEMEVDGPDNGIEVDVEKTPPPVSSTFSSPSKRSSIQAAAERNKLRRQLNVTPTKSKSKSKSKKHSPEKKKVYKVTSNMFTPRTRKLAEAGKRHARRVSTIEDPFPSDKHTFFLDVARSTAAEESLVEVFEEVKQDTDLQKLLTSFMGYARGGLFNSLAKKAREFTASYYALPGTKKSSEVKDLVTWLLSDGHFKYGGLNIEMRTFNPQKPFEADGIAHLLRLEYFATKGGANIAVFKEMIAAKRIKPPTIALMVTVLEHALMEYSDGTYRNSEFTDSAKGRYYHHLSSYNRIAAGAPTWANGFEVRLFNLVLNQSNKTFLLDVEADDMNEVDVAELEANAVAANTTNTASSSTEA
ncbi:hypothetical protein C8R42DRAFT_716217 [Lentinula raphanica]|nr:hypothetical protein C8R42DRAFT_716217 [Lentinula raphanica]